ncbi:helix-turn-helix domain-containing protein [Kitasatospora sp. NPDC059812]|uniref:helix-turn-helix domain-containing protein n=1 Tax=Kitasatospora sp. NPDC059812 TaxID=3346958 RepID=UPI00364F3678
MRYADGGGLTAKGRQRREEVRLEAAGLFADGLGPPEVARRLRVSSKSACLWLCGSFVNRPDDLSHCSPLDRKLR